MIATGASTSTNNRLGRVPISEFFHVTSQQPRKLQHIRLISILCSTR